MIETLRKPSSNIGECTYDSETEQLEVSFLNGRTYRYFYVPQSVWIGLQNAQSIGGYFARQIRNRFSFEEL